MNFLTGTSNEIPPWKCSQTCLVKLCFPNFATLKTSQDFLRLLPALLALGSIEIDKPGTFQILPRLPICEVWLEDRDVPSSVNSSVRVKQRSPQDGHQVAVKSSPDRRGTNTTVEIGCSEAGEACAENPAAWWRIRRPSFSFLDLSNSRRNGRLLKARNQLLRHWSMLDNDIKLF